MSDDSVSPAIGEPESDRALEGQVQKLYQISLRRRLLFVGFCWLAIAPFSLWFLREQISLGLEYFTWAVPRASLMFDPIPSLGLGFCIAITCATLCSHSYHLLFGFSPSYRQRLERQVMRIRAMGEKHRLWNAIVKNSNS